MEEYQNEKMGRVKWVWAIALILLLTSICEVSDAQTAADEEAVDDELGAEEEDTGGAGVDSANPVALQLLSQALLSRFGNFSTYVGGDIKKNFGFCVRDV